MKTLNLIQGSAEWHQVRLQHFTASEAPAMMNMSKYQTRNALLKLKQTGIAPEVNDFQQALFDKGHAAENSIRPYIESIIDDELFPVTGAIEIDGLKLLASFDGLTMMENVGFEHKLWNERLAEDVRHDDLHPHYYWQLEQLLLVSGAEYILLVFSDGESEKCVHMKYIPVRGRREQLIEGWKQFAFDLANYVIPEESAPKAIAEPVATLPAINYHTKFNGTTLELRSNIDAYKKAAQDLVEQSKKKLESDQDFANAEARIKACSEAEKRIAMIQTNVVGEVADIDKFCKDLAAISEMLRQSRLNEEKQVKARKEAIKNEIVADARKKLDEHINRLNTILKVVRLPAINADFLSAIKGKKTVDSLRNAANSCLSNAMSEANRIGTQIEENFEMLSEIASEHMFLFSDLQQLCTYERESLKAIAKQRIAEHIAAQEAKRIADEKKEPEQIPAATGDEYETYMAARETESFQNSFNNVFSDYAPQTRANTQPIQAATDHSALSAYQQGMLAGLHLAVKIFQRNGAANFASIVDEFIAAGVPDNAAEAA